ncbi:hypothetical protein ACVWXM_005404 [Bradyrhizobium sp. GM7.3]
MPRSAYAEEVPGTALSTCSICLASLSISTRSVPIITLTPIGVRIPVDSMSMRALIGMVQAFETPGNCSALSISAISRSMVMPGRQFSFGLRLTIVSNISEGAGSVAVAARPALPYTEATSGNDRMIRSWVCISSAAFVTEMPGSVVGM